VTTEITKNAELWQILSIDWSTSDRKCSTQHQKKCRKEV